MLDLQARRYADARKSLDHLSAVFNPSANGQAQALIDAQQGAANAVLSPRGSRRSPCASA